MEYVLPLIEARLGNDLPDGIGAMLLLRTPMRLF